MISEDKEKSGYGELCNKLLLDSRSFARAF